MGLDQRLVRFANTEDAELASSGERLSDEVDEAIYQRQETLWTGRKENHIHHVVLELLGKDDTNCEYLILEREHVQDIVQRIQTVLADHSKANELLPTADGFFFGSTEYDEWYFEDLQSELEAFTEALATWDDSQPVAYWSWW